MYHRNYLEEIGTANKTHRTAMPLFLIGLGLTAMLIWFGLHAAQSPAVHEIQQHPEASPR